MNNSKYLKFTLLRSFIMKNFELNRVYFSKIFTD